MKIAVVIPAGGQSARFGPKDKLAEDVGGRALLLRTIEFFTKREEVHEIIVAGPTKDFDTFKDKYGPSLSFHGVSIVKGGANARWESVKNALEAVSDSVDRVAIHDAARPALSNELFDQLLLASKSLPAVAPALPISGTVKKTNQKPTTLGDDDAIADAILGSGTQTKVDAFEVIETIDRTSLWELQTPQLFETSLIQKAYEQTTLDGCTDDAQVVEKFGQPVHLITGDSRNIKVTTQSDIALIRSIVGIRGEKERPAHKRF